MVKLYFYEILRFADNSFLEAHSPKFEFLLISSKCLRFRFTFCISFKFDDVFLLFFSFRIYFETS